MSEDRGVQSAPRGFHMRWWMWLLVILILAVCVAVTVRIHGTLRFAETQAELKRLGFATTPAELVAGGPAVDAGRQQRLRRLVASYPGPKWLENVSTAMPANDQQEQRFRPAELAKRDQALHDGAADVAEAAAILAEGPVELSAFGWCERDPVKLAGIDLATAAATPLPNLLSVRGFANWWSIRACLDDDPAPHLRNLDRLAAAMHHPGTLIDAMIAVAIASIRDQTYLWLAVRGRLPDALLQTWLAEEPEHMRWCAAGYAGERCLFQEPMSRMRWGFSSVYGSAGGMLTDTLTFLRIWPTQGHEAAYCCASIATAEAGLLGTTAPTPRPMPFGYGGLISANSMPNLLECVVTAVEAANTHRLLRCAALVATAYRQQHALPAALPASPLAGALAADLPPLRYEALSPTRFRIGVDPAGPLPPSIPASRFASDIGKPASTKTAVVRGPARWSCEIDLEAVLTPPPEPPPRKAP